MIDHYGIDINWEINLTRELYKIINQKNSAKIFVIDDLANRKHIADFLLDSSPLLESKIVI